MRDDLFHAEALQTRRESEFEISIHQISSPFLTEIITDSQRCLRRSVGSIAFLGYSLLNIL